MSEKACGLFRQRGTCEKYRKKACGPICGIFLPFCSAHGPEGRTLRKTKGNFRDVHAAAKIDWRIVKSSATRSRRKLP